MSLNIEMPTPNAFTGITGDVSRVATLCHVKRDDMVRKVWRLVLAPLMTEKFISGVIKNESFMTVFKLSLPDDMSDLNGLDWNSFLNVAAYQNLAQIADKNVALSYVPWQIRFEFNKALLPHMQLSPKTEEEFSQEFRKYQWHFWITSSGFCIAPLTVFENLKSLSNTYNAWLKLDDFRGAGFADFPVEKAEEEESHADFVKRLIMEDRVAHAQNVYADMPGLESPGPNYGNYHHHNPNVNPNATAYSAAGSGASATGINMRIGAAGVGRMA
jgi:hypothetical protein